MWVRWCIQAPMNLRNVVTIGTYRGGSVGGLEEGKGVQPILGRKNPAPKYKFCGELYAKSAFRFFTNLPPLNETSNIPLWHTSTIFRNKWDKLQICDLKVDDFVRRQKKVVPTLRKSLREFPKNRCIPYIQFNTVYMEYIHFWHKSHIFTSKLMYSLYTV